MLKDSPTMLVTKYSKIIADDTYIDILERLKWPAVILNAVLWIPRFVLQEAVNNSTINYNDKIMILFTGDRF